MTGSRLMQGRVAGLATALVLVSIAAGFAANSARATRTTALTDGDDAAGALDLRGASLSQSGATMTLRVSVEGTLSPGNLKSKPRFTGPGTESYLCVELKQQARAGVCFGRTTKGKLAVWRAPLADDLTPGKWAFVHNTRVKRPSAHSISVSASMQQLGLHPGHLVWRALSDSSQAPCDTTPTACVDVAPDSGPATTQIQTPRIVGCKHGKRRISFNGSRAHKRVALTFDDGPSSYTSRILATLRRRHVHATFFLIGQNIAGRESLVRRELRDGNEVGNHTMHHQENASSQDLASTSRIIRNASGFKPCEFRPPDGAINSGLAARAAGQGMSSILWDTDTRDWSLPGTGTIISRASAARSGSIVIMHDGGGPRGETAAAVPSIIHNLRRRGFKFVTITQMTGGHNILRP